MKKIIGLLTFILLGVASFAATFEKPILLTSVGQSADVQMVKILLKRAKIESTFDKVVTEDGLKDSKTLILAIGGSSKGLGAAGIKVEDEVARAEKLIDAATEQISGILKVKPDEIIYTSGASEANNTAIKGICLKYQNNN